MLFGTLYLLRTAQGTEDLAFECSGITYFAEPSNRVALGSVDRVDETQLYRLAASRTDITVIAGEFDQDILTAQQPFPGGGLHIAEYVVGKLVLVDRNGESYWQADSSKHSVLAKTLSVCLNEEGSKRGF